ncbi:hypothetical protein [Pelagicoccus mobilis]|uniref:Uncharacterized protein n=1 Tax=Pelagicoccus mobilis TaxID=415221 RepID=A0A934RVU9_9BACT|nr:hypothetical protein [Pelagicoccus mobilis]MBK1876390.1 hypothetical protein [Pelagicoccus mobilis]
MRKFEDQEVDKLFDRWKDDFEPDPGLTARVRSALGQPRGRERDEKSLAIWFGNAFSRPGLAAGFAAVFVLVGMGLSQLLSSSGFGGGAQDMNLSYRLSIDPLYRLQAMAGADEFANQPIQPAQHSPNDAPVLLAGLGWLQGELDLSEPQYEQVTALHGDYEMAFDELFGELLESHRAYRAFDKQRMNSDVIDYFQLYELLQTQKDLSEKSARLTEELLLKVEQIIEPEQRTRYRELLDQVYPGFSPSEGSKTDA